MLVVTSNVRQVSKWLSRVERQQVPFATAVSLTRTAKDAQTNLEKRLGRVFDRPTPFTRRAIAIRPARKTRLVARVLVKDIQARYLLLQETGGVRRPQRRALILPSAARRNQYGNLPRGAVKRMLARPDTFSGTVAGVAGIWQRKGRRLKLLVAYEGRAVYRPRFGFRDTAAKTARARFDHHLRRELAKAIATARGA